VLCSLKKIFSIRSWKIANFSSYPILRLKIKSSFVLGRSDFYPKSSLSSLQPTVTCVFTFWNSWPLISIETSSNTNAVLMI
jgi:hypothetical protein